MVLAYIGASTSDIWKERCFRFLFNFIPYRCCISPICDERSCLGRNARCT